MKDKENLIMRLYEILKIPSASRKAKDEKLVKKLINMAPGADRETFIDLLIKEGFNERLDEKPLRFILYDAKTVKTEDYFLYLMSLVRQQIDSFPFDISIFSKQTIHSLLHTIDVICELYCSFYFSDKTEKEEGISDYDIFCQWKKTTKTYLKLIQREIIALEQGIRDYTFLNGEIAILINNLDCVSILDSWKFQYLLNQIFRNSCLQICFFMRTTSELTRDLN